MLKPLSYIYSYINIPQKDWNDADINIWLYNGMKSVGISVLQQDTMLLEIKNHRAIVCNDYEQIRSVVVRENTDLSTPNVLETPTTANGATVQQTLNDQIYAIYPLLPTFFPSSGTPKQEPTWFFAKPKNVLFSKVCKDCPTYCDDCAYYYNTDFDGNLEFPQIETGLACVSTMRYPISEDEFLIDVSNQPLIDALASYVSMNYWEVRLNLEFTQQAKELFAMYKAKWTGFKYAARNSDWFKTAEIKPLKRILNPAMTQLIMNQ